VVTIATVAALCAFVAASVTLAVVTGVGRMTAWLVGTLAAFLAVVASSPAERAWLLLTATAALTGIATVIANRSLRYLRLSVRL
jgi:hypothetical protein